MVGATDHRRQYANPSNFWIRPPAVRRRALRPRWYKCYTWRKWRKWRMWRRRGGQSERAVLPTTAPLTGSCAAAARVSAPLVSCGHSRKSAEWISWI